MSEKLIRDESRVYTSTALKGGCTRVGPEMPALGSFVIGGLKLMKCSWIKKKGRCIRYGEDVIFCHPDDYKQILRGNAVGRRRLQRMKIVFDVPELAFPKNMSMHEKFIEQDNFEARYLGYWDGMRW